MRHFRDILDTFSELVRTELGDSSYPLVSFGRLEFHRRQRIVTQSQSIRQVICSIPKSYLETIFKLINNISCQVLQVHDRIGNLSCFPVYWYSVFATTNNKPTHIQFTVAIDIFPEFFDSFVQSETYARGRNIFRYLASYLGAADDDDVFCALSFCAILDATFSTKSSKSKGKPPLSFSEGVKKNIQGALVCMMFTLFGGRSKFGCCFGFRLRVSGVIWFTVARMFRNSQKCFRLLSLSSIAFGTGFKNALPAFESFV